MVTIFCRVTLDGYLLAAAPENVYTGSDRYWQDYYTSDFRDGEVATVRVEVPNSLAGDLYKQGTTGQVYFDGYAAWQAALAYMRKAVA